MNRSLNHLSLCALVVGTVALLAQNVQSQVVYDNGTPSPYYGNYNFNDAAAGNEIILANAGNTYISSFIFQFDLINSTPGTPFVGAPTGTEEVDLSFYANDGANVPSGAGGYPSPGTLLYDSGFVTTASFGLNYFSEGQNLTYAPDVSVPQDFTWVVTFADVPAGESAGLALRSLPTVGAAYGDVWENDGSGWQLLTDSADTEGNLDLGAEALTVPEPSWLWSVNAAVAAGFCWMRRSIRLPRSA